MENDRLLEKMQMILTVEEFVRCKLTEKDGEQCIEIEMHGLTRITGRRLVNNVINLTRGEYTIILIHGFNSGTVLKEMIRGTKLCSRVVKMMSPSHNPGVTYLKVVA